MIREKRLGAVGGLLSVLGIAGIWLGGCNNACQDICRHMANYAEDCGLPVSDGEVSACVERQSAAESEDLKACRDFGDPETIRNQWTCDDLEIYWNGGGEEGE